MRASLLMLIVLAICASSAQARIFTCKDKDGNTVYSDTADVCPDAEEVQVDSLPPLIETKPLAIPKSAPKKASKQDANGGYKSLAITTPSEQETIRENTGIVKITYKASPALKAGNGHQYVIMLGGTEVYKGPQDSVVLENVDRGTHAVTAKIIASDGRTLISSKPVQFTLQRFSRLQGNNPTINTPSGTGGFLGRSSTFGGSPSRGSGSSSSP